MRNTPPTHNSRRAFLKGSCCMVGGLLCLGHGVRTASGKAVDMTTKAALGPAGATPLDPASAALAVRIKAISNIFEVGGPLPDYRYVENLGDGRGYTVTNYGFCTSTGEVSELIKLYMDVVPNTPLKHYLALMPPAVDTEGTPERFPADWRREVDAGRLAAVCDEEADRMFYRPAMKAATAAGVHSPIGRLVFYDTLIQHGSGDDPDSFSAIFTAAMKRVSDSGPVQEADLLRAFLAIRRSVLLNPSESGTRHEWQQSVTRVDALLNLLNTNPDLVAPVTVLSSDVHVIVG
jgi:chitosanase